VGRIDNPSNVPAFRLKNFADQADLEDYADFVGLPLTDHPHRSLQGSNP
jgi:hypothetical protein